MYLLIIATAENLGLNHGVNTYKLFKQKRECFPNFPLKNT